ncbi:hypothetical protein F5Y14DRAFT_465360 [Nemania sp. NC0429]|nr:hypothetical protein F5Y14DRAFT_465360 [Nemania sp. NC0429]
MKKAVRTSLYHLYSIWLFTFSDLKTILFPQPLFGTLTALSRIQSGLAGTETNGSLHAVLGRIPMVIFWVWIHLLPLDIHNQQQPNALAEDKINKPWRPLPSSRGTIAQAGFTTLLFYGIASLMSYKIGTLRTWYNSLGGSDVNAFIQNFIIAVGYTSFGLGALEVAQNKPLSFDLQSSVMQSDPPSLEMWVILLTIVILTTIHVQDMEDQEETYVTHRKHTMRNLIRKAVAPRRTKSTPSPSFPQFNQLPFELRHMIWDQFALPAEPMLFTVMNTVCKCFDPTVRFSEPARIGLPTIATTRALMQVNKEARKAVLRGRQLQKFNCKDYDVRVFTGCGWPLYLRGCFFVNWEVDCFYLRERRLGYLEIPDLLNEGPMHQIKNIAIDLESPLRCLTWSGPPETESDPGYRTVQYDTLESLEELKALQSLKTIYLVYDFDTLTRVYASVQPATENDSNGGGDGGPHSFDPKTSYEYGNWVPGLPKDKYGFYHLGPEPAPYFQGNPTFFFRKGRGGPRVELPFKDWVRDTELSIKNEAEGIFKRPVDVQMVTDPLNEDYLEYEVGLDGTFAVCLEGF